MSFVMDLEEWLDRVREGHTSFNEVLVRATWNAATANAAQVVEEGFGTATYDEGTVEEIKGFVVMEKRRETDVHIRASEEVRPSLCEYDTTRRKGSAIFQKDYPQLKRSGTLPESMCRWCVDWVERP